MRRGEIWRASLREPEGSEPGGEHPVLVIQSDRFNETEIRTVTVVPITSNLDLAKEKGNEEIGTYGTGLDHASVVNVSQTTTVDRGRLIQKLGNAPARVLKRVEDGLRLVLDL